LVSLDLDVMSLFGSVLRQALVIQSEKGVGERHQVDRKILGVEKSMELTDLCLDSTYFQLAYKFYEQRRGLAMGSPLSPVLADVYMERMEVNIKEQDSENYIYFGKLHVEDIITIICREGDYLNKIYSNFTCPSSKLCMDTHIN
jgi:hypothetical protein